MRNPRSHSASLKRAARLRAFPGDRAGTSAVEFAIVFPVFLAMLFGIVTYGAYLAVVHGVQQLTAEAARAAIAGLTDEERAQLARQNIAANAPYYAMVAPARIAVTSAATDPATSNFSVTVRYDASDLFVFSLPRLVPAPNPIITRSAAIQRGGY